MTRRGPYVVRLATPEERELARESRQRTLDKLKKESRPGELACFEALYVENGKLIEVEFIGK